PHIFPTRGIHKGPHVEPRPVELTWHETVFLEVTFEYGAQDLAKIAKLVSVRQAGSACYGRLETIRPTEAAPAGWPSEPSSLGTVFTWALAGRSYTFRAPPIGI